VACKEPPAIETGAFFGDLAFEKGHISMSDVINVVGGIIFYIVLIYVAIRVILWFKHRKTVSEKLQLAELRSAQQHVAAYGSTWPERVKRIDATFEARTATLSATFYAEHKEYTKGVSKPEVQYSFFTVNRSLANMDNRERAYLRITELLNAWSLGNDRTYGRWRAALLWGDGKGVISAEQWQLVQPRPVQSAIVDQGMRVDQIVGEIQQFATRRLSDSKLDPEIRPYLEEFASQTAPAGGGTWLKPTQVASSPFAERSPYPLHIGSFADGTALTYSGDGSMVTIAPPGSGKTQCNVFPNLLTWKGPAVVLDISGDIYEHTGAWRSQNVGPVYRFSPLEPEASHHYNPLTFVRSEPDFIWEDSRLLAEMMIVPSLSTDPFWENEARTVLTAAIAFVAYSHPPDQRPMNEVLDILFGGPAWDNMILGLRVAVDVRVMTQHATSLSSINEKTLSSVLQTARSSLGAWTGERIARATSKSDWSPLDLRNGTNPTIYIYIRPNEVEAYLSLLRVFIGQHIRMLTGGPVPPQGSPPILLMLDELPRLRNMPPVDEALNIGRKYGLRLWMFAQSVGQLQTAYENADGMLGSCAVRIFMNPTGADGMAEKLSEELGYVESLNDNSRKRLVEAAELAGPAYQNRQIVIAGGAKPVVVSKDFAYQSAELVSRMAASSPALT
jgi:type IV secretion system protein VirD4